MDGIDYDIAAHLILRGPSSPRVVAYNLKASRGYVRRRIAHLSRRGIVRRVGWGLYAMPEPPEESPARRESYWKLRAAFENQGVPSHRKLKAAFEMCDLGHRFRGAALKGRRRG